MVALLSISLEKGSYSQHDFSHFLYSHKCDVNLRANKFRNAICIFQQKCIYGNLNFKKTMHINKQIKIAPAFSFEKKMFTMKPSNSIFCSEPWSKFTVVKLTNHIICTGGQVTLD